MHCSNCGNKLPNDAKFCNKCGTKLGVLSSKNTPSVNVLRDQPPVEYGGNDVIKCGNCEYVGPGEPARTLTGKVLAWLCIFIAWPITLIYFLSTHKYRCPKCKSTFLGVKSKEGIFVGQKGGDGSKWVFVIIVIFISIAIIAVLAAIVLVNVTSYINKGKDAAIESNIATIITNAVVYHDENESYHGFTDTNGYKQPASVIQQTNEEYPIIVNGYIYNDRFCICSNLKNGNTYCMDDSGNKKETSTNCSTRCNSFGVCND